MGSVTGHKIDYNGAGVMRGQRHIQSKTEPKYQPPPPPPPGIVRVDAFVLLLMMNFVIRLSKLLEMHCIKDCGSWIHNNFDNVMTEFIVNKKTAAKKLASICFFFFCNLAKHK